MSDLGTHSGDAKTVATIATGSRHFRATTGAGAATGAKSNETFELNAGASVVIHFRTGATGVTPPDVANTVTVDVFEDNSSAVIRTFTAASATVDEGFTFFATSNGQSGGTARAGTYRVRIRAQRTDVGTYDVNSDNGGTPPAAGSSDFGKGYLRAGTAFSSFVYSDASLGGAAPTNNRFVYPKSQFFRATLGDQVVQNASDVVRSITLQQFQASVQKSIGTANVSLATPGVLDITRTGGVGSASGVNNDFLVGDTNTDVRLTALNSTLSLQPWTHFTSLPSGWTGTNSGTLGSGNTQADKSALYTVDPRITFTQLLQLNSSTFATPPSSTNVASGQRLTSDLAFLAARATDANGGGVNGLAWTEKLWDAGNLISSEGSPWKSRSTTSATQGGQAGWSDAFMTWDAQLPGGGWTQKEVITSSKATGLEAANTRSLTLLAANSNILVIARITPASGNEADHVHAGDDVTAVVTVIHASDAQQVAPDAAPSFFLLRYNPSAARLEYLDGSYAWQSAVGGTFVSHSTTAAAGDAKTFTKTFTGAQTAGWGNTDLLGIVGRAVVGSTPYISDSPRELAGRFNGHARNDFDPTGLFM